MSSTAPPLLFAGLDTKRASAGGKGKYRVAPDGQGSENVGEGMMKTHCTLPLRYIATRAA